MRLENIVWDARDPQRLGRFWSGAVGAELMTDEPDIVETRLHLADGAFIDLCFAAVPDPSPVPSRLHLDLSCGADQHETVRRLVDLGARPTDIGQGAVPWVVLADPEGNTFCVMEDREAYSGTGPIAALPLQSADPERDVVFWTALTGWVPAAGMTGIATLRHPSGTGPLLELCPEQGPKRGKNRLHLDVRRDVDDDGIVEDVVARGAVSISAPDAYPWRTFVDPSGNEFCILAPSTPVDGHK